MLRLRPYLNVARRRLFGNRTLRDECRDVHEIHPQSKGRFDPVIAVPGEKARVTATIANHDLQKHLKFFGPQDVVHAPVIRYRMSSALVLFNGVAGPTRNFNRRGPLRHRDILRDPIHRLDKAAYCLEDASFFFFGHWMRSFAQCLLAEADTPLLHFAPHSWTHAPAYETLFGLRSLPAGHYHVENLTLFQDYAQSPHKAARYRQLRQRLQDQIGKDPQSKGRIYLKRGTTGAARLIEDEARLEDELDRLGFETVDLSSVTIDDLIRRCTGADIALTIEGSHADHLHWLLKPGGTLWILNPADHFNTSQFAVAQVMGNKTACSVIEPAGNQTYRVDMDRLKDTFELILK